MVQQRAGGLDAIVFACGVKREEIWEVKVSGQFVDVKFIREEKREQELARQRNASLGRRVFLCKHLPHLAPPSASNGVWSAPNTETRLTHYRHRGGSSP